MAAIPCQAGGWFSRCPNLPQHSCQYCGRQFCSDHSHFVEGHEAVCSRKRCREKRDDMARHLEYRTRADQLNRAGLCGVDGCNTRHVFQCSLCKAQFCEAHLSPRRYGFGDGWSRSERWVSVCPRCWDRRRVWRGR
jgi:hypothetical protein